MSFQQLLKVKIKVKVMITYMHKLLELEEALNTCLKVSKKVTSVLKAVKPTPLTAQSAAAGIIFSKRPLLRSGY